MKSTNKNIVSYHDLGNVLKQLIAVAASLVFGDGFRFFFLDGIRIKISLAARAFAEADGDEAKGARAAEILDEAVSWLRASLAKWMKVQLVDHFEVLLSEVKNKFGVDAPEVVDVFLTLEEFKKSVSGRIEDFPLVVEKAKNFERRISQVENRVNVRKALVRSAENEARRAQEKAKRAEDYSAHAAMLEGLLDQFDSEVGGPN